MRIKMGDGAREDTGVSNRFAFAGGSKDRFDAVGDS
jgi:hypothetical protein